MVQIQSLAPSSPADAFCFFIEIDGHMDDANVAAAMEKLCSSARSVTELGSYMIAPAVDDADHALVR